MNFIKMRNIITTVILAVTLGGCAVAGGYNPPLSYHNKNNYSTTVNKSFDKTWSALIEYAASTFFSIENFEKESGLLTLSFGSSNADEYIDCGTFSITSPQVNYDGPYAGFREQYYNGQLQGKMNIFVKELSPTQTMVRVNARYIFTSPPDTWTFDSGSSSTLKIQNAVRGSTNTRTCRPTYKAENTIMNAVKSL